MANIQSKFKTRYGLSWPVEVSEIQIMLTMWKHWKEPPYSEADYDAWDMGLRAARNLFNKDDFIISPWTENHFYDWTTENFCITWGGASCSKSNDYGLMSLLDWMVDPMTTTTIFASTTKGMLKLRSWESVVRYFRLLKKNPYFLAPGKEAPVSTAILNDATTDATEKSGLRGLAVREGSEERARANLAGSHNKYMRWVIDEISQMSRAALDGRINASIGCRDFRYFGLANPDSYHDLGASVSVPITPGGWNDVDENCTEWRSVYGKVRHHNGLHSPAITEPGGKEKYPHLINQDTVDNLLRENHGNLDSPVLWSQVKGFPPPEGDVLTVLSDKDIHAFRADQPIEWAAHGGTDVIRVAGLDPAFSSGGDNCVLQFGTVGMSMVGDYVLDFDETLYIPIKASEERPAAYQISDAVITAMEARNVPMQNLAVDDSGTQSVADILQVESKVAPIRCNFGARASEQPISAINPEPAFKRVANQTTEIAVLLAELVRSGQVRDIPEKTQAQLTSRTFVLGKRPQRLEAKADYKKRTGIGSPDEGDASCLCALAARQSAGLFPGKNIPQKPWVGSPSAPVKEVDLSSGYQMGSSPSGSYSSLGLDNTRW
jgi:hypothetical protein